MHYMNKKFRQDLTYSIFIFNKNNMLIFEGVMHLKTQ